MVYDSVNKQANKLCCQHVDIPSRTSYPHCVAFLRHPSSPADRHANSLTRIHSPVSSPPPKNPQPPTTTHHPPTSPQSRMFCLLSPCIPTSKPSFYPTQRVLPACHHPSTGSRAKIPYPPPWRVAGEGRGSRLGQACVGSLSGVGVALRGGKFGVRCKARRLGTGGCGPVV